MRFWPSRGRRPTAPPPPADLVVTEDLLRRSVEALLLVRELEIRGGIFSFRGELLVAPARALDLLLERLRPVGYTPFLRASRDGVVVQAWPLAETTVPQRIGVNILLFVLTCASTLLAGLVYVGSPTFDALRSSPSAARFLAGTPFAATLMGILVVHQFGHYFTSRYYKAAV